MTVCTINCFCCESTSSYHSTCLCLHVQIGSIICKRAAQLNAGIVVMAKHNKGCIKEFLIGSCTNYCECIQDEVMHVDQFCTLIVVIPPPPEMLSCHQGSFSLCELICTCLRVWHKGVAWACTTKKRKHECCLASGAHMHDCCICVMLACLPLPTSAGTHHCKAPVMVLHAE